jgi:hypothetical protein
MHYSPLLLRQGTCERQRTSVKYLGLHMDLKHLTPTVTKCRAKSITFKIRRLDVTLQFAFNTFYDVE